MINVERGRYFVTPSKLRNRYIIIDTLKPFPKGEEKNERVVFLGTLKEVEVKLKELEMISPPNVLVSFDGEENDVWLTVPGNLAHRFADILSMGMYRCEFHGKVTAFDALGRDEVTVKIVDGKIDYTNA